MIRSCALFRALIVGVGVGHAPGDVGVVTEVGETRAAGKRQADCVEVGTGDMVLVVDVGGVEAAVWVARHKRLA